MGPDRQERIQNPPPDVKEKLRILAEHTRKRDELAKRLAEETAECLRLEQELAPYYSSIAPVHDCPAEILSNIFSVYLESDPRLVYRLMLVCTHWYRLVINDPKLWTHINVAFDTSAPLSQVISSTNKYVAAYRRSNPHLPVSLELDFSGLFYSSHLRGVESIKWRDTSEQRNPLDDVDIPPSDLQISGEETVGYFILLPPIKDERSKLVQPSELITALLGDCIDLIGRCRSMTLTLPLDGVLASEIWLSLSFEAPQLEALWIYDFGSLNGPHAVELRGGFRSLTSLKHLEIQEVPGFDFVQGIDVAPLQTLGVSTDLGQSPSLRLDRFPGLIHLTITATFYRFDTGTPSEDLHLPNLQRLDLYGNFVAITEVEFNLPALQYLYMHSPAWDKSTWKLPNITVPNIGWANMDARNRWSKSNARERFVQILNHFEDSKTLIMPLASRKMILSALDGFKVNGSLPGSWRELRLQDDKDELVEVISIRTIS